MAKIEITINGVAYPCRPTMGAMLRFKRETGKEINDLNGNSFTEVCTYLYCCVASASAADGIAFDYSLMDFADAISPADLAAWSNALQANTAGEAESEKKRPRRKA